MEKWTDTAVLMLLFVCFISFPAYAGGGKPDLGEVHEVMIECKNMENNSKCGVYYTNLTINDNGGFSWTNGSLKDKCYSAFGPSGTGCFTSSEQVCMHFKYRFNVTWSNEADRPKGCW